MVICGDFNYPKILWDTPDTSRGANEQAFLSRTVLSGLLGFLVLVFCPCKLHFVRI